MNVRELIDRLSELDQDLKVIVVDEHSSRSWELQDHGIGVEDETAWLPDPNDQSGRSLQKTGKRVAYIS